MTIDELADKYPDINMLKMDGFDGCAVGVIWLLGAEQPVLAYNRFMVLKELVDQGMSYDDAVEFHEFNQAGAYMGPGTPVFIEIDSPDTDDDEEPCDHVWEKKDGVEVCFECDTEKPKEVKDE